MIKPKRFHSHNQHEHHRLTHKRIQAVAVPSDIVCIGLCPPSLALTVRSEAKTMFRPFSGVPGTHLPRSFGSAGKTATALRHWGKSSMVGPADSDDATEGYQTAALFSRE